MKRYLAAILAWVVIVVAGCATDPYHNGFKAYRNGEYGAARQELAPLAEQGDDVDRGRAPRRKISQQPGQGQPGIDDVLDDNHPPTGDVAVEILEDADDTR